MMAGLAEQAEEVLDDFTPQGLANLAWGLTVAACYPPTLVRRWRTRAGGCAGQFGPAELNQLHLVEVALRLEAPEIGAGACACVCLRGCQPPTSAAHPDASPRPLR